MDSMVVSWWIVAFCAVQAPGPMVSMVSSPLVENLVHFCKELNTISTIQHLLFHQVPITNGWIEAACDKTFYSGLAVGSETQHF